MSKENVKKIQNHLAFLYGPQTGEECFARLQEMLDRFKRENRRPLQTNSGLFGVRDVILITYGDLLTEPNQPPLQSLQSFHQDYLGGTINIVHILPFFPYSSDDGFSVIDYKAVNPDFGSWQDIAQFHTYGVKLMFDAVINHISSASNWFKNFLIGDPNYENYFIEVSPDTDLSMVARPRALPLLAAVSVAGETRHVWTTFSADQIDLNYQNPDTLLDVLEVLLFYVLHGANLIRLDAIAYLWKEIGTSCIHLPQTHTVVQLVRAVLEEVAPDVLLITETNVPHEENLSYFGNGYNEAHMVYHFSLPPLTAHALITGSAVYLSKWASGLRARTEATTFMNFSASHDGVGIRPALGILPPEDIDFLVSRTLAHGGKISSKTNPDGSTSPYELNITYFDLLNDPGSDEPLQIQVKRFLVSQAIVLAMVGIPGIYIHSLLGSRNYTSGVEETGQPRSVNREKLKLSQVVAELGDPASLRHAVFYGYQHLLKQRIAYQAFHPNGSQQVLQLNDAVFSLLRISPDGTETMLALHNVSQQVQTVSLDPTGWGLTGHGAFVDVLTGNRHTLENSDRLDLNPYQIAWMRWVSED